MLFVYLLSTFRKPFRTLFSVRRMKPETEVIRRVKQLGSQTENVTAVCAGRSVLRGRRINPELNILKKDKVLQVRHTLCLSTPDFPRRDETFELPDTRIWLSLCVQIRRLFLARPHDLTSERRTRSLTIHFIPSEQRYSPCKKHSRVQLDPIVGKQSGAR